MIDWPPLRYVLAAALGALGLYYALQFLFDIRSVVVIVLFGVLFGLVLVYPMNLLARCVPRWVAALLLLAAIVGLGAAAVVLGMPFVERQVAWLGEQLPASFERLQAWWNDLGNGDDQSRVGTSVQERLGSEIGNLVQKVVPVAFSLVSVLSGCLAVLALALFFAYDPGAYRSGLVRLFPARHARTADEFLHRLGSVLQRWMTGTLISMTITGALIAAGMLALGIESWLVLGVISFVLEFVPYIGPTLAAVPGVAIGFAVSPHMALWVAGVYGAVQLIESYVLQPLIMKRAIWSQPAVLLVWQLAMGTVFGLLGVFTATPLLACLQAAVQFFREQHGEPAHEPAASA